MLQQLAPIAGAKVAALEAEATNANTSRGKKVRGAEGLQCSRGQWVE